VIDVLSNALIFDVVVLAHQVIQVAIHGLGDAGTGFRWFSLGV
jgi:hypothetical protein